VLAALQRALRLRFGARLVLQTEADALLALVHLRRQ
jgi:hypothetical protein